MRPTVLAVVALLLGIAAPAPAPAAYYENGEPPPLEQSGPEEIPSLELVYDSDPSWDWRSPTYAINYGTGLVNVESPFWVPLEGLEDQDYEPEDGWVLMARNFGSATVQADVPFLILYNKYRGVVRFMIHLRNALHENYTHGRVTMRFSNSTSRTKSLNARAIQLPLSKHVNENPVALINLQDGWNYADFTVGYDPNTPNVVGPMFIFEVDGVSVNTVALDGESQTTTVSMGVTDLRPAAYHQLQAIIAGYNRATKGFNNASKTIDQLVKYFNSSKDEASKAKFASVIAQLTAGKVPLSLITGIIGFAEGFLGYKRPNNTPTITTSISHLTLTGTIQAEEQIKSVPVRVPGANHGGMTNALPVWDYPLGLIAILNDPPTTYRTSSSSYNQDFVNNPCTPCGAYLSYFAYMDILHLEAPVQYAVNTSFPGALALRSIEAAWTFQTAHPKPQGSPTRWDQTPPVYINHVNGLVNSGRYVLIGSADPLNKQFYEYRTQFVDLAQFHNYRAEVSRLFLYGEPYWTLGDGITPPVQVRARFQKPGATPNEDIFFVQNYDLWWPNDSPLGHPGQPWNPGSLLPVWKEAEAPVQAVTAPVPGQKIARGAPWQVQWQVQAGSINDVQLHLSTDNGATYPTLLGSDAANTGSMTVPAINTLGTGYRVRVRTVNAPAVADDAIDGPFTVWGVNDGSISGSMHAVCSPGPKARLHVSWTTNVATNGADHLRIWSPSGVLSYGVNPNSSPLTSHYVIRDFLCVPGTYTYQMGSTLDGVVSWGPVRTVEFGPCMQDCGPGGQYEESMGRPGEFFLRVTTRSDGSPRIEFGNPKRGPVRLDLFDIRGRRVADLTWGDLPAGEHTTDWSRRDRFGNVLEPGVYFLRLDAAGRTSSSRFVLLR